MNAVYYQENDPSLLAILAAFKKSSFNLELIKTNSTTKLCLDGMTLIEPVAIVCLLLNVDPITSKLCDFVKWRYNYLQPTVFNYCFNSACSKSASILEPVLAKLVSYLSTLYDKLSNDEKMVFDAVLFCDLCPLFHELSEFKIQKQQSAVLEHYESLQSKQPFGEILKTYIADKTTIKKMWFRASTGTPQASGSSSASSAQAAPAQATLQAAAAPIEQISEEEIKQVKKSFQYVKPEPLVAPAKTKLPIKDQRNILITSALPYVNNVPHLGNLIGSTLSANVFALYCDLAGYNCLAICGTDEYGTATETKAQAEGKTPREICDFYNVIHNEVYDWFDIKFDYFGRTTTQLHTEITQEIFRNLWENKSVVEDSMDQLFCENCSKFLADRYVEGICPLCKYEDARGDQCDKCGRVINAVELIQPKCKSCTSQPVVRNSKHLFLDLPHIEPKLEQFLDDRINNPKSLWTQNAITISRSWLRDGLKKRCITRDLKWGVPVPLEKYKDKVFYVWFDAPIGYISITANYTDQWRQWWQPIPSSEQANVEYFQFMAKDNVPFHSVIFPSTLLASDSGHTLVNQLISTEYMNYEATKFSKSRGIGVFGDDAMNSGIASNIWRFYLLFIRPEAQDSAFMWDDFMTKNNSELLNNLGNFINRALMFVNKFFENTIPACEELSQEDSTFVVRVNKLLSVYIDLMERCKLRDALKTLLLISGLGNQYLQVSTPWVLVKKEQTKKQAGVCVAIVANVAALLALLLHPYMPAVSNKIWNDQLEAPRESFTLKPLIQEWAKNKLPQMKVILPEGHKIGQPSALFQKLEPEFIKQLAEKFNEKK